MSEAGAHHPVAALPAARTGGEALGRLVDPVVRRRLTRLGWAELGVAMAVGAAAVNTANNLLYLLLALMLVAHPLSAWLAARQLRRVRIEVHPPSEVTSGDDAIFAVRVAARHDALGLVLSVHELEDLGRSGGRRRLSRLVRRDDAGWTARAAALATLSAVAAESPVAIALKVSTRERGHLVLRMRVASVFPFGLVEARAGVAVLSLLVLPRPLPASPIPERHDVEAGDAATRRSGDGDEILEIREQRPGDAAPRIDWKATARLDRPMVREHEAQRRAAATIVVDTTMPPGDPSAARAAVERVIGEAAGLALELDARGRRVRLRAPGASVDGDAGDTLRALATVGVLPPGAPWRPRGEVGGEARVLRAERVPA